MKYLHLRNITLLEEFRNLPEGLKIDLKMVTLLVGDQGCGKSSLLQLLRDNSPTISVELSPLVQMGGINSYYFDSESMNPRIGNIDSFTNIDGSSKGIGIGGFLNSKFKSHGEVLRKYTVDMIGKAKTSVMLIDEPESALSLVNQYKLALMIQKAADNHAQLIIATHCLPIIECFEDVYDMENKKWCKSSEYLAKIKELSKT